MRRFLTSTLLVLAFFSTWAASGSASAASGVQDKAGMFTAEAIQQARTIIDRHHGLHSQILVVTEPTIPDGQNAESRARDIAELNRLDGVILYISKKPGHFHIEVGNETRVSNTFTAADRQELVGKLQPLFKAEKFDDALLGTVGFIESRENTNRPSVGRNPAPAPVYSNPAPNPSPDQTRTSPDTGSSTGTWIWIWIGIGILVVVFIIMGAINRNRAYGAGYGSPPPGGYPPGYGGGGYPQGGGYGGGGGGGGGGFGRGLLGGLLGGALGAWGYEKFNRPDNSGSPQGGAGAGPNPTDQPDSSYSGSGGDFGSSSDSSSSSSDPGGGDFGSSGDSGGGGDFGGGGDSGSSGGDF